MPFNLKISQNLNYNDETFKIQLHFDFLQIFYGTTMKQRVQKLCTTRSIKKDKSASSRLKSNVKMLGKRSGKTPDVQVKLKNAIKLKT